MGLPGHHRTSSDKRKRAAHFHLDKSFPAVCSQCKKPVMAHMACPFCGNYKGRSVKRVVKAAKAAAPKAAKVAKAPKAPKTKAAK